MAARRRYIAKSKGAYAFLLLKAEAVGQHGPLGHTREPSNSCFSPRANRSRRRLRGDGTQDCRRDEVRSHSDRLQLKLGKLGPSSKIHLFPWPSTAVSSRRKKVRLPFALRGRIF